MYSSASHCDRTRIEDIKPVSKVILQHRTKLRDGDAFMAFLQVSDSSDDDGSSVHVSGDNATRAGPNTSSESGSHHDGGVKRNAEVIASSDATLMMDCGEGSGCSLAVGDEPGGGLGPRGVITEMVIVGAVGGALDGPLGVLEVVPCVVSDSVASEPPEAAISMCHAATIDALGQPKELVPIKVHAFSGETVANFHVPLCSTIWELKQQIRASGGPPVASQVLLFGCLALEDAGTLQQSGIVTEATLQLVCVPVDKDMDHYVKAVVRCRPMSSSETDAGCQSVIVMDKDRGMVHGMTANDQNMKSFAFDAVFDGSSLQHQLFHSVGRDLVDDVIEGYNSTVIAYGQTGAGKSHTLFGPGPDFAQVRPEEQGLVQRSFKHLFARKDRTSNMQISVSYTFVEIYNEGIRDLLSRDPAQRRGLTMRPDGGASIKDGTAVAVSTLEDMERVFAYGLSKSAANPCNMKAEASRVDTIATISVETRDSSGRVCRGTLKMVECNGHLGCCRGAAGAPLQTLKEITNRGALREKSKEAITIGLSLSALGNVVSALTDSRTRHVPYRDSKLTRLLQDSLGGNSKTLWIGHVIPTDRCYEETVSTLRYTHHVKLIKNKPIMNMDAQI